MKKAIIVLILCIIAPLSACSPDDNTLSNIPEYSGKPYVVINNNIPNFSEKEKSRTKSFEKYSRLDIYGRCQAAYANISTDLMPRKKRGKINSVYPTGWVQRDYAFIRDGKIYNRCHLIGYQLTGENANERNLITGTRYMNTEGMLPFENKVAEYVTSTKNHVLYRVTPVFERENLLANGVEMEAWSVEDNGKGICFNVYCYNVQPGVMITYANGNNRADGTIKGKVTGKYSTKGNKSKKSKNKSGTYIVNINSMKFHIQGCEAIEKMSSKNKKVYKGKRADLIKNGFEACQMCEP